MHKKAILLFVFLLGLFDVSAQKESNVKLKIETGILGDWYEGNIVFNAFFLHVEPKLKTSKNTIIGLRIGTTINSQALENSDPQQFYINNNYTLGNVAISLIPTFDFYFIKNKFRPYLGLGLGYYFLTTPKDVFVSGNFTDAVNLSINNQIGFLLRGGLDLRKFKVGKIDLSNFIVGLELNYLPKANIEIPNGQKVGTINYSNIILSLGYLFGKGKSSI